MWFSPLNVGDIGGGKRISISSGRRRWQIISPGSCLVTCCGCLTRASSFMGANGLTLPKVATLIFLNIVIGIIIVLCVGETLLLPLWQRMSSCLDAKHPKLGNKQNFCICYTYLYKIIKMYIWILYWPMV